MKKTPPLSFTRRDKLEADTGIEVCRYYLCTNKGNFLAPPFAEPWKTLQAIVPFDMVIESVFVLNMMTREGAKCHLDEPVQLFEGEKIVFGFGVPMYSWRLP